MKTTHDATHGCRHVHRRRRLPDGVRRARPAQTHVEGQRHGVARTPESVKIIKCRGRRREGLHRHRGPLLFGPDLVRAGRLGVVEQPGQGFVVAKELELLQPGLGRALEVGRIGGVHGQGPVEIGDDVGARIAGATAQAAEIGR